MDGTKVFEDCGTSDHSDCLLLNSFYVIENLKNKPLSYFKFGGGVFVLCS